VEAELKGDEQQEAKQINDAAPLWISGLETAKRQLGVTRVIGLGDARIDQASLGSGDDFRCSGAARDRGRDLGRPPTNRRPVGASRPFLSSELCHFPAASAALALSLPHQKGM